MTLGELKKDLQLLSPRETELLFYALLIAERLEGAGPGGSARHREARRAPSTRKERWTWSCRGSRRRWRRSSCRLRRLLLPHGRRRPCPGTPRGPCRRCARRPRGTPPGRCRPRGRRPRPAAGVVVAPGFSHVRHRGVAARAIVAEDPPTLPKGPPLPLVRAQENLRAREGNPAPRLLRAARALGRGEPRSGRRGVPRRGAGMGGPVPPEVDGPRRRRHGLDGARRGARRPGRPRSARRLHEGADPRSWRCARDVRAGFAGVRACRWAALC